MSDMSTCNHPRQVVEGVTLPCSVYECPEFPAEGRMFGYEAAMGAYGRSVPIGETCAVILRLKDDAWVVTDRRHGFGSKRTWVNWDADPKLREMVALYGWPLPCLCGARGVN